ncbi:MAG: glycosyltransferase family 4 protein [Candidatus Omnitrophota bacterium]
MNILYISNHLNIGGITSYLLSLSAGMKHRGHNVYIASSGGRMLSKFREEGITYASIPIRTKQEVSPKILLSMFKLSGLIKKHKIELLHSNSRTTQVLGCLLSKFLGVKHISTCHGFFKKRLFRKIFPCWGQKVIAISEPVKEHLIRDFKVNEKDIVVIHSGVDTSEPHTRDPKTRAGIKERFGLGKGPVVGIVARLSDVKGHTYLIEAMEGVLKDIPEAALLIAGEGKMKEGLVSLVKSLGIEKSVVFLPEIEDTRDVLSAMDLFVMPSLKEGLGLALMEAMAFGLAVIGTDTGGIKSLIQDGYNGLLVRPKDSCQLQKAISGLLKDEQKRGYLGGNARDFICRNFSLEKMAQETEEVYLQCPDARH